MPVDLFADRYERLEHVGSGGFGHVWRALDRHLNREVALKIFIAGVPLSNALLEAQRLMDLESPHILRVFNVDAHADVPYLVTEYAPLGSSDKQMRPHGVPPPFAVRWMTDCLLGLDLCHGRGILHRDVTPGNVFLADEQHARLGDMGIAEFMDSNGEASMAGTPAIRAPELWISGRGGKRADIYAAGITLYALLTGQFPYGPPTIDQAIIAGRCRRIRDLAPHVPRKLAMRVERAMNPVPGNRYNSARDLADDLSDAIVGVRSWMRVPSHAGHVACWREFDPPRTPVDMCVSPGKRARQFDVLTHRRTGSKSRLVAHCHQNVPEAKLPARLRHIFDALD